jgi:hypothetical protein
MLLVGAIVAATPLYIFWQGDAIGAAIIGIPTVLIGFAAIAMVRRLSA